MHCCNELTITDGNKGRLCYPTKAPSRSWYFSQRTVTVQGGYGVLFAFMQGVCEVEPCRDTMPNASQKIVTGYKTGFEHWSSVAVQCLSEPEICHGAGTKLRVAARVRMKGHYEFILMQEQSKKYDKQLTFTERVSLRNFFSNFLILVYEG